MTWQALYQLAGLLGVDPGPLTLREILLMAEGRRRETWNHTAALLAMLFNTNRDPKKAPPAHPLDFHPLEKRRTKAPALKVSIKAFKGLFTAGQVPVPQQE